LIISLIISLAVIMTGCNNIENLSNSGSMLIVDTITGTDLAGEEGSTTIFSDVLTGGTVFNDTAVASLRSEVISNLPAQPSIYQDIIVDQIDISYSRADRINPIEGKDVPYGFSQKVNLLAPISTNSEYSFILIQHTAKLESPLVELISFGQEKVLKLEANITFYGKDTGGKRVAPAKASVSIWCADFGDSD
ncbi:MAG TPA: hypothetical protein VK469_18985, partial [Candidatus Kapabacteria bacterium]|nr:hypothetical protein [Candidatus Kapabacteria bacterium]